MINKTIEIPSLLYHYTTKEILIEYILNNYSLKIGSFKFTNDPREYRFSAIPIFINGEFITSNNIQGRAYTIFEEVRFNEWNVLCLSMDSEFNDKQKNEKFDTYQQKIYETLELGSSNASMWAHYAANHSGACLILDGKAIYKNIKKTISNADNIFYGPVTYTNVSSKELNAYRMDIMCEDLETLGDPELRGKIRNHVLNCYKEMFLSKFIAWETENEFRFLINKINQESLYIDLNEVLKKVILGHKFKPAYYPCVTTICREKNIPVYWLDWQNRWPIYRKI